MVFMKIIIKIFFVLLFSLSFAEETKTKGPSENPTISHPWFSYMGMGYAWSAKGIEKVQTDWYPYSPEGYNSTFGNSSFYFIGLGRAIIKYLSADLSYTNYETFNYQKFQSGCSPRTRFFNLDNQSVLVNFTLLRPSAGWFELNLKDFFLAPFLGGGLGVGINDINHFYTILSSEEDPGKQSSIGDPRTTHAFAWQVFAGLNLYTSSKQMFFDIGYKYYDGGTFKSPNKVTGNATGEETRHKISAWKGRLKTQQIFGSLRFAF